MRLLMIALLVLLPVIALASTGDATLSIETQPSSSQSFATTKVTVQRVAQPRQLSAAETASIDAYMVAHRTMSAQNARSLRAALLFLTAMNQSHFPLTRTPAQYLADYQTFTQMYNRTDWYVNIPEERKLPPFEAGTPIALLPGMSLNLDIGYTPVPCARERPGAYKFGTEGSNSEVPVAVVGFTRRDNPKPRICEPKTPGTCDPLLPGDPRIPVPPPGNSGVFPTYPPDTGGHSTAPLPAPTHGTGGQAWDPSPSHPHVADPVN